MSTGYESNYPASGYASESQIRNEFEKIQQALEDTISRSGTSNSSGTDNAMSTFLNMDDNDIINAGSVYATSIILSGTDLLGEVQSAIQAAIDAGESASEAAQSALESSLSAALAGQSVVDAQGILNDFRNRYFGAYSYEPTESPTGAPIDHGDLYYDLTEGFLKVWGPSLSGDTWRHAGLGPKGDKGDKGDVGATGVFISATATTLSPGSSATVTMGGTPELRTITFGIPKGNTGEKGEKGDTGARGASFSVDKVGLLSELSDYDDEEEGFVFFATDVNSIESNPPVSQTFPYSASNQYTLSSPVGGEQVLLVFVNNIFQSDNAYSVSIDSSGIATVNIVASEGDFIHVREVGSAAVFGVVFFKLSNATADWSDPVPFGRGPQGEQGAIGPQGTSAFEDWLAAGNTGTVTDFLLSLKGDTGLQGSSGLSAYEIWLLQGNSGTQQDFLDSLKGSDGTSGVQEAPNDGHLYVRRDADWVDVSITPGVTNPEALAKASTTVAVGSMLVGGGNLSANMTIGLKTGATTQNPILMDAADLHTYTTVGNYVQLYKPYAKLEWDYPIEEIGFLEVTGLGSTLQQKYVSSNSRTFLRYKDVSTPWSTWKELIDVETVNSLINDSTIGQISMGPYLTIPTGWLLLDGSAFSATTYPKLASYVESHYKVVAASEPGDLRGCFRYSLTPDHILLPDMQGMFVRGQGGSSGALGTYQADNVRSFVGSFAIADRLRSGGTNVIGKATGAFTASGENSGGGSASINRVDNAFGATTGQKINFSIGSGTDTRPKNVAWKYIIKAE